MYGYVYLTTNLITNKKYVGKHISKVFEPSKYIGSGRILLKAVKKYGKKNFICELLEWCADLDELNAREKFWIAHYNAVASSDFYNVAEGGDGASSGELNPAKSLEVRQKISANNAMQNPIYREHLRTAKLGKSLPHTGIWNKHISEALTGRTAGPLSDVTKQKISVANSGERNGMFGKSAVVGTKWYNNGKINIRSFECPDGFVGGMLRKGLYPGE